MYMYIPLSPGSNYAILHNSENHVRFLSSFILGQSNKNQIKEQIKLTFLNGNCSSNKHHKRAHHMLHIEDSQFFGTHWCIDTTDSIIDSLSPLQVRGVSPIQEMNLESKVQVWWNIAAVCYPSFRLLFPVACALVGACEQAGRPIFQEI